ncbi:MAG: exodeoxyribonuclease VII small subunit [Desulfomonile tiedjei]|uniref:Exodeoxyribonuclease 7 small subunit n=1 Tax=Desulfomonile tiedjei TaxID=2358 RepID=A0A9D6V404_9BACT|nr:exodeoxyribonuclease VII small subunit [Desulfomonile tiedjei]
MKKPREQQESAENFDQQLEKLRFIVEKLEHGGLTLDESLKLFEEGIALSRMCMETLNHSEGKVEELLATMERIPFSRAEE